MTKERIANLPEDDFRRNAKQFQEPLLSRNLALADLLEQIGARRGVSAGVVAIAWTLANPAITAAIVGGTQPAAGGGGVAGCEVSGLPARKCRRFSHLWTPISDPKVGRRAARRVGIRAVIPFWLPLPKKCN